MGAPASAGRSGHWSRSRGHVGTRALHGKRLRQTGSRGVQSLHWRFAVETGQTIEGPHMGMRLTCRDTAATTDGQAIGFDLWIRADAPKMPMHIHPRQEERITVVSGRLRSRSGKVDRVLSPGQTVFTPPGEAHTIAPTGDGDVEVLAELRPALEYERFMERVFALDRAGRVNAKGRANPIRMATASPHTAEFFLAGIPVGLQRTMFATLQRAASRLGYDQGA